MKIKAYFIAAGGGILALLTIPHFFTGYPMINELLAEQAPSEAFAEMIRLIWIFGNITMFLCGYSALMIGFGLLEGNRVDPMHPIMIGLGIAFFGVYGYVVTKAYYPLVFVIPGLLIFIPNVISSKEYSKE